MSVKCVSLRNFTRNLNNEATATEAYRGVKWCDEGPTMIKRCNPIKWLLYGGWFCFTPCTLGGCEG